jgi:UDP-galactose transporter B1
LKIKARLSILSLRQNEVTVKKNKPSNASKMFNLEYSPIKHRNSVATTHRKGSKANVEMIPSGGDSEKDEVSTPLTESTASPSTRWQSDAEHGRVRRQPVAPLLQLPELKYESQHNGDEPTYAEKRPHLDVLRLCFGCSGVLFAYLIYGSIQEDVFRYRGEDGEKFQHVWFLQVLESVVNVFVGLIAQSYFGGTPGIPITPFLTSGASQVFAKALTSLSLSAGLSFPVCTLAKSAKIVPVMLGQLALGGSRYTVQDYALAGAIVMGTALLSLGESSKEGKASMSSPIGIVFILLSLVMDGVTAGLQKRLKSDAAKTGKLPTTYDFLLYTNLSMAGTALTISIINYDFVDGWIFLTEHPDIQRMIAMVCLCSAVGQSFIFYVVAQFDPLVCATVTTTRKILSVVWSIATKGHHISGQGCVGLGLAIGGLLMEIRGKVCSMQRRTYETKDSNDLH